MTRWLIPAGMTGDLNLIRVGAGMTGDEEACPQRLAAKARPRVGPRVCGAGMKPRLETFALDPVMEVLDRVEHDGDAVDVALARLDARSRPLHPALNHWVGDVVRAYLGAERAVTLVPVRSFWVLQRARREQLWELYAWGRRYQSPDGSIRELRLFRFGAAGARERDQSQVAVAAYSVGRGAPAMWPDRWSDPFQVRSAGPAERVRIVEVGCADGSRVELFDGTVEQADMLYAEHGRARVRRVVAGGAAVPSAACVECKLLTACDALPRIPNVLAIANPSAPLRSWSVTDGRYYRRCPAQQHLRGLNLRAAADEYSLEATRGHAVHAWLEASHARRPVARCLAADVPDRADDWSAGGWRVCGEQAEIGALMIAHHVDVCAFGRCGGRIGEVRLEPTVTLHDTAANVIVVAKPDLLYLDDGSWVWRETKTTQRTTPIRADVLETYPQVALAVLILHENVLGGDPSGSRIELEVLRPNDADIELVDPNDPDRVAQAREIVRGLAAGWHGDEVFPTSPGPHCQTCPVSQWCPDSLPSADA
jgi:PD-(D/E)XK nuclease superfamily